MAVPQVGDVYVPSVGPDSAKVMIVGEAPGKDEEAAGEPFVGKSGQFLEHYLGRCGIRRRDIKLTNICKYRPKGNKFENLLGSPELEAGVKELEAEILRCKPHLLVGVGAWPMYYLTGCTAPKGKPGTGISAWRGSVVPCTLVEGHKVLITYHPAFVVRPQGFGNHPIFLNDLKKIKREAESPDLNYPHYDAYVDPPNLRGVVEEMMESEWLTVDIETFGESLACVGFADSVKRGLCVTFENPEGWDLARMLLSDPASPKKIFQYGAFDINYLNHYYGWVTSNYAFDTYIAAANLLPEFKRGLDFLTSIYTPLPFYKEERKTWKNTGDLSTLWLYNIKDVISTHWIAMEQMRELNELYGEVRYEAVI